MKAAAFAYHRPEAIKEAVDLLVEYGDDAKVLAGGQSLVPMLAMRLTHSTTSSTSPGSRGSSVSTCATAKFALELLLRTHSSGSTTRWPTRCRC